MRAACVVRRSCQGLGRRALSGSAAPKTQAAEGGEAVHSGEKDDKRRTKNKASRTILLLKSRAEAFKQHEEQAKASNLPWRIVAAA
jgi:hypothetical protein